MYVLTRNGCSGIPIDCIQAHYQNNPENRDLFAGFIKEHFENKRITKTQLYVLIYVHFRNTDALDDLLPGFCKLYLESSEGFNAYIENACESVQEWNAMCAATGLLGSMVQGPDTPTNAMLPVITEDSTTTKAIASTLTPARQPEERSTIASLVEDGFDASRSLSDVTNDVANSPLLSHRLEMVSDDKHEASRLPPASSIPHFGPVFPDSKAIIYRAFKPYIHGICGRAYAHPSNVRHHHEGLGGGTRRGCKGTGTDKHLRWDDHPSCKITLSMLNYKSVAEGVVIVDQESLDKVNAAIAAGLAFKEG